MITGKKNPVSYDNTEYVLVKYYVETNEDLHKVAENTAIEETIGIRADVETTPLLEKCKGRVHSVDEIGKGRGIITLEMPILNMDIAEAAFPHLWMYIAGGPVFELNHYQKVCLLDFELPPKMLAKFPGPKFGLKRIREMVGAKEDELLLGTIVKPCCGLRPAEVARKIGEAAMAGVSLIKDDEKMNNPAYCPLEERVRLVISKLKEVYEKTGRKCIYCCNITTRTDRILEKAHEALENGANGLMLNMFASGFSALEILAEDSSINVPIYCHSGTRSAWARVPNQGIKLSVVAKLARLMGADFFRTGILGGYCVGTVEDFDEANRALQEQLPGINDTVLALSGGLCPGNLVINLKRTAFDAVYMAGGGLLSHPMGIRAGVKAFQQAADAHKTGIPLNEFDKSHKELEASLNKWGS